MKKFVKRLSVMLVVTMIVGILAPGNAVSVNAAGSEVSRNYDKNDTYYSVFHRIFKIDCKTGESTQIAAVDDAFSTYNLNYYKGYIYFTANYFLGTGGENQYVCRIKKDGTGFQKLAKGSDPIIYGNKIYYVQLKHYEEEDSEFDSAIGIGCMSLNGRNVKQIVKKSGDSIQSTIQIVQNKLYFVTYKDDKYLLNEYNLKNKKNKVIKKYNEAVVISNNDSSDLYITAESFVTCYNVSKKTEKVFRNKKYTFFGGKNGKVYASDYASRKLYEYNFGTGKKKLIKSNVYIDDVIYSKSGYNLYFNNFTDEEYVKSDYMYTNEIAVMKPDGTGYKSLIKYYES